MTPSRAGTVSASEIVEYQPLGLREGPVRMVAGGSRASSLLALSERGGERGKPQDTDTPVSPWSHGPFSHQPRCQRPPPLRAPASIQLPPSPPSPHPRARAQPGCVRDEAGSGGPQGPPSPPPGCTQPGGPSCLSPSACLCLRLCVRHRGSSSGPWVLARGCLSGCGQERPTGMSLWGSGVPCHLRRRFPEASRVAVLGTGRCTDRLGTELAVWGRPQGPREGGWSKPKAEWGRQGHRLMPSVEGLPLFQTPIIFHPLAFPPSFQDCRGFGGGAGTTVRSCGLCLASPGSDP